MDLKNYKKDLTLEVMNERGHVAKRYFLHRCWVSEFTAVPDLDANANAIAIESCKIELEGWERDVATKEPDEGAAVPASA
jgi:phage tail-like protein